MRRSRVLGGRLTCTSSEGQMSDVPDQTLQSRTPPSVQHQTSPSARSCFSSIENIAQPWVCHDRDHDAVVWWRKRKAEEGSFETAPSSLSIAVTRAKALLKIKAQKGVFHAPAKLYVDSIQQERTLSASPRIQPLSLK